MAQLESYGDNTSRHFTREPWWVVVVATVATAILPIWKAGQFRQAFPGVGMIQGMCMWGAMGFVASTVLVLRSRVRSPFLGKLPSLVGYSCHCARDLLFESAS